MTNHSFKPSVIVWTFCTRPMKACLYLETHIYLNAIFIEHSQQVTFYNSYLELNTAGSLNAFVLRNFILLKYCLRVLFSLQKFVLVNQ